jgi:hypothetical protein
MPITVELSVMNPMARLFEARITHVGEMIGPIECRGRMTTVEKSAGWFHGAAALIRRLSSRARVLPVEDFLGNRQNDGGTIAAALNNPETRKAIELCLLVSWHN